jgi:hypothetical protein
VRDSLAGERRASAIAWLSQFLSNRYYFHTQSDHRTIEVPVLYVPEEWIWEDFAQKWNAKHGAISNCAC